MFYYLQSQNHGKNVARYNTTLNGTKIYSKQAKGGDCVTMDTELTSGVAASRPVTPMCPFTGVEHVRAHVVLVRSVYQLGGVVAGKPAVNTLSPAIDPPALLDHRHRAVLHLQDGPGFGFSSHRKLR